MMVRLGHTQAGMSKVCSAATKYGKSVRVGNRLSKMIATYHGSFEYIS